jgi:ribose-phosphate pyrophosphokinase
MSHEILILADKEGGAYNFAKGIYNNLFENPNRERTYSFGDVEIKRFNDGEIFAKVCENVRKRTCFFIHDSSMNPQDWLVSLALVNDALKRSDAAKVDNILPYMRYSRQDRMAEPRTPISSRIVADIVQDKAYRVITTDLHNPAIQGSYKIPFDNLKAYPVIIKHLKENYPQFLEDAVVVSPDVGSAVRAKSYANRLGLDVVITDKERKKAGLVDRMTLVGDVNCKNAIIVDDMIDSGQTLCKSAELLKQKGAKSVYACATHGLFSKDAKQRINDSCLEKVIVTDSIPQKLNGKIEIVSLTGLFGEAVHRISHGESISELFN